MPEFISSDQVIHYELVGATGSASHTPVLMLHGNGEDMGIFADVVPPLMSAKSFVLMDSRLHGESHPLPGGSELLGYDAIAEDALALMEHLGIFEYDVVGYSDGGIAALIMAMRSRDIRKLITIGANITPEGLSSHARREMRTELRRAVETGDARNAELMRLMLEEPRITTDELASIICEATIVLGSRDRLILRKHSERIADAIPHGSHLILRGAGHGIPSTHPDALAELIRTLL